MRVRVMLDRIRSMYNVGSFFRTCDGAGVAALYLTGYTAHPPRKEISKTALGAEETVPWEHGSDPLPLITRLKSEGVQIIAVEKTDTSVDFREVQLAPDQDVCFVFGNEKDGVSQEILEHADLVMHLPMLGHKGSLNVAVAGGAVLYHDFGDGLHRSQTGV